MPRPVVASTCARSSSETVSPTVRRWRSPAGTSPRAFQMSASARRLVGKASTLSGRKRSISADLLVDVVGADHRLRPTGGVERRDRIAPVFQLDVGRVGRPDRGHAAGEVAALPEMVAHRAGGPEQATHLGAPARSPARRSSPRSWSGRWAGGPWAPGGRRNRRQRPAVGTFSTGRLARRSIAAEIGRAQAGAAQPSREGGRMPGKMEGEAAELLALRRLELGAAAATASPRDRSPARRAGPSRRRSSGGQTMPSTSLGADRVGRSSAAPSGKVSTGQQVGHVG